MKLQNLTVIFIIIVLPLVLILSYYISLQIDTSNMQTSYNTKLLDATKEAIEAFEINTVEWNEAYSETGDSKRRAVMASVNTFTNSFANSLGVGGATKDYILSYVPAIAFTMYDGYYIYSPSETKTVIKDENGVGVTMQENLLREKNEDGATIVQGYNKNNLENDQGKILYQLDTSKGSADGTYNGTEFTLDASKAQVEYSHILKPFNSYSARYANGSTNITVNYTLDNYITIYGKIKGKDYDIRSGYLINTSSVEFEGENNKIKTIKVNGSTVGPETLTETIYYNDDEGDHLESCNYVYEAQNNTKVYFDGQTPFQVSSTGERTDLEDTTTVMYKKISILSSENSDEQYFEIFQALNDGGEWTDSDGNTRTITKGTWYIGEELSTGDINIIDVAGDYGQGNYSLTNDFSAMNYYVESYAFSNWINSSLSNIETGDMIKTTEDSEIADGSTSEQIFTISGNIFGNNVDYDSEESVFQIHKKEVMKSLLINNLNQAITSYAGKNTGTEYSLPVLEETDWDKILNNVSITAFIQGIPIGMKYYNNYAVATSTNNKEYVNPDGIYLTGSDEYYHIYGCNKIEGNNLIGFRSADYIERSYEEGEEPNTRTVYYSRHQHNKLCYYCLVDKNQMEETESDAQDKAYLTALARERYNVGKTRLETVEAYVEVPEVNMEIIPYNEDGEMTKTYMGRYATDTNEIDEGVDQYIYAKIVINTIGEFDYYNYRYRVNNEDWIDIGQREVDTTRWIEEGEYKIEVQSLRNGEVVSTITKTLAIDNTGPTITISREKYKLNLIQTFNATITDKSGVLQDSVYLVNDLRYKYDTKSGNKYTFERWMTIDDFNHGQITAIDNLGNRTTVQYDYNSITSTKGTFTIIEQ